MSHDLVHVMGCKPESQAVNCTVDLNWVGLGNWVERARVRVVTQSNCRKGRPEGATDPLRNDRPMELIHTHPRDEVSGGVRGTGGGAQGAAVGGIATVLSSRAGGSAPLVKSED